MTGRVSGPRRVRTVRNEQKGEIPLADADNAVIEGIGRRPRHWDDLRVVPFPIVAVLMGSLVLNRKIVDERRKLSTRAEG